MKNILFLSFLIFSCQFSFSQIEPTETNALLNILITDFANKPKPSETVIFVGQKSKKTFKAVTGADGKAQLLIPEGDIYDVSYRDFVEQVNYSKIDIPVEIGKYTYDLQIKFEPEKVFTLKDVFFDTGKSTLKPESSPALNELVGLLKAKPTMKIEIAGHTDSDGEDETNIKLSQGRANAVMNYLINKGIASSRLTAKGYGETQPVAGNDTESGKQQNRRTEVRIISE
ncbi:MAG: hypothetical protein CVU05_00940 [Bacteroidetes bacterium HGW-Bacteroidetes-21]|nr:MAG: hypothetical protein CVU05_00940 [Bacteroidetes bacterium HGW-Bacteroidetes-21]